MQEKDEALVVLRCDACGDTFPVHQGDPTTCPSCGSSRTHPAGEPLL